MRLPRTTTLGWRSESVKALLISPRPAGLRRHRIGDGPVALYPAAWPAIIDAATHDRLVTMLTAKAGKGTPHRRTLLTGLCRCSLCGSILMRDSKGRGYSTLVCKAGAGKPGCGRLSMRADAVEDAVNGRVLAYIEAKTADLVARAMTADNSTEAAKVSAELGAAERFKLQLAERLARSADFDDAEIAVMRRTNAEQIAALRARLAVLTASTVAARWDTVEAFEAAWKASSTDEKWGLLRSLVDHVTIGPGTGKLHDAGRVSVTFRR